MLLRARGTCAGRKRRPQRSDGRALLLDSIGEQVVGAHRLAPFHLDRPIEQAGVGSERRLRLGVRLLKQPLKTLPPEHVRAVHDLAAQPPEMKARSRLRLRRERAEHVGEHAIGRRHRAQRVPERPPLAADGAVQPRLRDRAEQRE